ncbi:putative bifunctional diguanylate cyclase/phosphodiesterase [Tamilnaduibacter salinus]|nr:EAL domain-containing protein [Tamilnaduibacter salinus]
MQKADQRRSMSRFSRILLHPALPALMLLAFVVLAGFLWHGIQSQSREQVRLLLDSEVSSLLRELEGDLVQNLDALRRMAERRETTPSLSRETWRADARQYIEDFNHYRAIEWIDTDYAIRWVEPREGNYSVIGWNVAFNDQRARALSESARTGQTDFSGIIELEQGGRGLVAYVPIGAGDSHLGFIAGVFELEGLVEALIASRLKGNFRVNILEHGQTEFSVPSDSATDEKLTRTADVNIPGLDWQLQVTPSQRWVSAKQGLWPMITLLSLTGLGLLISALAWSTQLLLHRNRSLLKTRAALEEETRERESIQQDLVRLASTDTLTGLANRRFFMEDLSHTLSIADRQLHQVALITIDLDRFQILNDTLGHQFGDELLIRVAERLNDINDERVLTAYSSGDEFLVCQQHVEDIDEVIHLLGQIRQCFRQPFTVHGEDYAVTATMGVAVYPQSGLDADTLMRNADVALYRAKEKGRDLYQFYTEGMQDREVHRLELDRDLDQALAGDQLALHFQPQLDLATGQVGSVEALIRWHHPTRGLVSPGEFIPLAEESGRIADIGRWVAIAACRQLAKWSDGPLSHLRIAINLSGRELETGTLASQIRDCLTRWDVDPSRLELELTEEVFIASRPENLEQLRELHDVGVHLAIDDFGVGYSSLAYLRDFPVNLLKIDRSFITRVTDRHDDAVITGAVIQLSHSLGIQVAAEGVETEAQLSFLRNHHCDLAQGFLISHPVPADQLEREIRQGHFETGSLRLSPLNP